MAEASFGMESGEPVGVGGPAPPLPPTGNPAAVPAKTPSVSVKDDSYAGDYAAYTQRRMTVAAADRSVALAITRNPDEYARYSRLSRQMGGWDPELILDNADAKAEVDRREKLSRIDINSLIDTSPETVAWLANPQRAAVAHDDVPSMTMMETLTKNIWAPWKSSFTEAYDAPLTEKPGAFLRGQVAAFGGAMESAPFGFRHVFRSMGAGMQSLKGMGYATAGVLAETTPPLMAMRLATRALGYEDPLGQIERYGVLMANKNFEEAQAIRGDRSQMNVVQRGVLGAVESLTQMAALWPLSMAAAGTLRTSVLARSTAFGPPTKAAIAAADFAGAAGFVAPLSTGTGAQSYADARKAGLSVPAALFHGVVDAGIEMGTEMMWAGKFLAASKGGTKDLFKGFLKSQPQDQAGEILATVGQDFNKWAMIERNKGKTWDQFVDELPEKVLETIIATATMGGVHSAMGAAVDYSQRKPAESFADSMTELMKTAGGSKLLQRDSSSLATFLQQASGDATVIIDADKLVEVAQTAGLDLAAVLPNAAAQIANGEHLGIGVEIPVGDLITKLAGTPAEQAIIQHLRPEPGSPTLAEVKEAAGKADTFFQKEAERILEEQQRDESFQQSADEVYQHYREKIAAHSPHGIRASEAQATALKHIYTVLAARWGVKPTDIMQGWTDAKGVQHKGYKLSVGPQGAAGEEELSQEGDQADRFVYNGWVYFKPGAKVNQTSYPGQPARVVEVVERGNGEETQYRLEIDVRGHPEGFDDNGEPVDTKYSWVRADELNRLNPPAVRGGFSQTGAGTLFQTLPSRWPTSKGVVPSVNDPMLADLETLKLDPKQYEKAVEAVASEPGMRVSARKTDTRAEAVITKLVDNLLWLHDQIPAEIRERSKLWYDGARQIADSWAAKYNVSTSQAAGILAVLSPQKDWFMNVTMGERVLDILSTKMDHKFDAKMRASAFQFLLKDVTKPAEKQGNTMAFEAVKDKTLREVVNGGDMLQIGIWLRSYDEAHHDARHTVIHPEGDFGDLVLKDSGEPASRAWGGFDALGKAATIYLDGRPETINEMLGGEHKVRNFYNNIFNPSDARFATIDTHAVAAAMLRPLAGNDKPVADNFGKTGGTNVTGVSGTYPIYFEAYKRAAEARGILPREMQSITWEAVRGLFPDTFKTKENKAALAELWSQADKGKLTISQAREKVTEMAGGIRHPDWWNGAEPAPLVTRDKSYEQTRELEPGRKIVFEVAPTPDNAQLTKRWTALPVETQNQISADMAWSVSRAVFAAYANVANVGRTTDVLDNVKGELHLARGGYMGFANASMSLRMGKYASFPQVKAIASMLGHVLRQREVPITSPDNFKGATKKETVILVGVATKDADSVYTDLYNAPNLRKEDGSPMVEGHTTEGGAMVIIVPEGRGESIAAAIEAHVGGKYDVGTGVIYDEWLGKEAGDYGLSGADKSGGRGTESSLRAHADRIRTETDAEFERRIEEAERAVGVFYQGAGERQGAVTGPVVGVHYSKGERNILASSFSRTGMSGAEWERLQTAKDDRIKQRINFYVNTGKGVTPESDVGNFAHVATLDNLYDTDADVLKLHRNSRGDMNTFESAVLDAGFSGYLTRGFGDTGAVVMLGSRSVPVEYVGGKVEADQRAEVPPGAETPAAKAAASAILGNRSLPMGQMKPDSWQRILTAVAPDIASQIDFSQLDPNKDYYRDQIAGLLWQPGAKAPLGSFAPATLNIELLQNANLSTFVHELGHFYLTVLADMASQPDAPADIVADMTTVLNWFGISSLDVWRGMSVEEQRPFHEKWAETHELYLFTGKAPTIELQPLFNRFADWMTRVYTSIKEFLRGRSADLTPEVSAVMDRMYATQKEIEASIAARAYVAMFKDAAEAGMSPEKFAAYMALSEEQKATADELLRTRGLRDMKWLQSRLNKIIAELQADAKEKRAEVLKEIQAEVEMTPLRLAIRWLKHGEMTGADGTAIKATKGHKLQISALEEMYPPGAIEGALDWRKLGYGQYGMLAAEGLHPDMVADIFGFTSGRDLVEQLITAPSFKAEVEALTDQAMLEAYGDLSSPQAISRAADEALSNDAHTRMVATELSALAQNVGAPSVLIKAAREYARQVIDMKTSKTLKPLSYSAAATRARKAAQAFFKKGKLDDAAASLRTELANDALAKEGFKAEKEIKKLVDRMRKIAAYSDKSAAITSRDFATVQAVRSILADHGIGVGRGEAAAAYLELVQAHDSVAADRLKDIIAATSTNPKDWRDIKLSDLRTLAQSIDDMWFLAQKTRQIEIQGKMVAQSDIVSEIMEVLQPLIPEGREPGVGQAVTEDEKRSLRFASKLAHVQRVEYWADRLDGNRLLGPLSRYIVAHVKDAEARYQKAKADKLTKYLALLEPMRERLTIGKIDAPEIGYTFGADNGAIGRAELLHAILHTGNKSNMKKLLLGRKWGAEREDGSLDTTKWDAFINRLIEEGTLTQQDFDFCQNVWDLLESLKADAQKAHRAVFGKFFNEVTADSFENKFGKYRGGYVPAIVDSDIVKDAEVRKAAEDQNDNMSLAFPAPARGFTKSRSENYDRPLLLDIRSLGGHINKVLLFSHMAVPVEDVRRIITSPEVEKAINRVSPGALTNMLTPWLNRSAKQITEAVTPDNAFWSRARANTGMSIMMGHIANAIQQITGFASAAVKVKVKYLAEATAHGVSSPSELAANVRAKSAYMATRLDSEVASLAYQINEILLNPTIYESAKAWTNRHAYFLQSTVDSMIAPVIWTAAYNQARDNGATEPDAVRIADGTVRMTQGASGASDIANIEAGPPYVRLFTQFMGYANGQAQLLGGEWAKNMARDVGLPQKYARAFGIVAVGFLAPAVVGELIMQAFRGGPDDEDKDGMLIDDWLAQLFVWGPLKYGSGMVPVFGPVIKGGFTAWNDKPYDDRLGTAPVISVLESGLKFGPDAYAAIVKDGKPSKPINDAAMLIGLFTGLPTGPIGKRVGYLADVAAGKVKPTGVLDAIRGTITGAASPESKKQ